MPFARATIFMISLSLSLSLTHSHSLSLSRLGYKLSDVLVDAIVRAIACAL